MNLQVQHRHALLAADGTPRLPHVAYDDDGYPYSDGAPLGQNVPQSNQLYYAFPALRKLISKRFPGAFAASDMFVYPRKGEPSAGVAPDIFVAFGVDCPPTNSYKLWKHKQPPAFVLEVLSSTTADNDLGPKRLAYEAMGVRELWLFDPSGEDIPGQIAGYRLHGRRYRPVAPMAGTRIFRCDVLGLEFRAEDGNLRIHDPATGKDLRHYDEICDDELAERQARLEAEEALLEADQARLVERDGRLAERDARLEADQARLAERSSRLEAEKARLEADQARLVERDGRLAERDARLEAEKARLAAEAEVARLRDMLADRDSAR